MNPQLRCEYVSSFLKSVCGGSSAPHRLCDGCGWVCRICADRPCQLTGDQHVFVSERVGKRQHAPRSEPTWEIQSRRRAITTRSHSDEFQPVMTFDEIAAVLGLSRQRVQQIYVEALRKLRRHPEEARKLRELVDLRNSMHVSWDDMWNRGETEEEVAA